MRAGIPRVAYRTPPLLLAAGHVGSMALRTGGGALRAVGVTSLATVASAQPVATTLGLAVPPATAAAAIAAATAAAIALSIESISIRRQLAATR
jgi:hypothetical protein